MNLVIREQTIAVIISILTDVHSFKIEYFDDRTLVESIEQVLCSRQQPSISSLNSIKFTIDKRLQERNIGILENMEFSPNLRNNGRFGQLYGMLSRDALKPSGAESGRGFWDRIFESLNSTSTGLSVVFAHGGVMGNLTGLFTEKRPYIGNCGFIILDFDDITQGAELKGVFQGFPNY